MKQQTKLKILESRLKKKKKKHYEALRTTKGFKG